MVDDYLLFSPNNKPTFAKAKDGEMWVPLLEKAWAKLLGSYTRATGGSVNDALNVLTGCPALNRKIEEQDPDDLWELLKSSDEQDCMMGAGSIHTAQSEEVDSNGVIHGHAYTILSIHEFDDVRLLQMRNPHGCSEWKGEWADGSSEWTDELNKMLGHTDADDGTFFMPLDRFIENYAEVYICANQSQSEYDH